MLRFLVLLVLSYILYRLIRSLIRELITGNAGIPRWHAAPHHRSEAARNSVDLKDVQDADFEEIDEKDEEKNSESGKS